MFGRLRPGGNGCGLPTPCQGVLLAGQALPRGGGSRTFLAGARPRREPCRDLPMFLTPDRRVTVSHRRARASRRAVG